MKKKKGHPPTAPLAPAFLVSGLSDRPQPDTNRLTKTQIHIEPSIIRGTENRKTLDGFTVTVSRRSRQRGAAWSSRARLLTAPDSRLGFVRVGHSWLGPLRAVHLSRHTWPTLSLGPGLWCGWWDEGS